MEDLTARRGAVRIAGCRAVRQDDERLVHRDLRRWEGDANGKWVLDSGSYTLLVGKNAEDAEAAATSATLVVQGD